jgi:copper chaperone CopZ
MFRFGWINSVIGGLLISLSCPCCFFQLVLNVFGIGCASLNNLLLPYRPIFVALTVISLTYSFIRYRPSKRQFCFIVTLTALLSMSPELLDQFRGRDSLSMAVPHGDALVEHWRIIGMHCDACRSTVERALLKVPAILSANVDLNSGQADLMLREPIDDGEIIETVQNVGFQAYKMI